MIRTRYVYSPIELRKDGLRILVSLFRGQGLPKSRYHAWMANLGPSEGMLRDFQLARVPWGVFVRRYRRELFENAPIDCRTWTTKNREIKVAG